MVRGLEVKRVILGLLKKNVANKKIRHTRAKCMINIPVIVGKVYLTNKKIPVYVVHVFFQ